MFGTHRSVRAGGSETGGAFRVSPSIGHQVLWRFQPSKVSMASSLRQSGIGPELTIGLVRRGFSSGGAEAYLKRLAAGMAAAGHRVLLFSAGEWPVEEGNFGSIVRLK